MRTFPYDQRFRLVPLRWTAGALLIIIAGGMIPACRTQQTPTPGRAPSGFDVVEDMSPQRVAQT